MTWLSAGVPGGAGLHYFEGFGVTKTKNTKRRADGGAGWAWLTGLE
jgi:hypothetical protein